MHAPSDQSILLGCGLLFALFAFYLDIPLVAGLALLTGVVTDRSLRQLRRSLQVVAPPQADFDGPFARRLAALTLLVFVWAAFSLIYQQQWWGCHIVVGWGFLSRNDSRHVRKLR